MFGEEKRISRQGKICISSRTKSKKKQKPLPLTLHGFNIPLHGTVVVYMLQVLLRHHASLKYYTFYYYLHGSQPTLYFYAPLFASYQILLPPHHINLEETNTIYNISCTSPPRLSLPKKPTSRCLGTNRDGHYFPPKRVAPTTVYYIAMEVMIYTT